MMNLFNGIFLLIEVNVIVKLVLLLSIFLIIVFILFLFKVEDNLLK